MIEPAPPPDRAEHRSPHEALVSDGGRAALLALKTALESQMIDTPGLETKRIPGRLGELEVLEVSFKSARVRVRAIGGEYWGETRGSERGWVIGNQAASPLAAQSIRDMLVSAAGVAGADS